MNKVILTGRATKDITLSYTASQKPFVRFTLAVNRWDDKSDFISCVAWNKVAELITKYVKKGHRVGVIGRIQTGSYDKNGQKIYTTDVVVDELEFLQTRSSDVDMKEAEGDADIASDAFINVDDSELPF